MLTVNEVMAKNVDASVSFISDTLLLQHKFGYMIQAVVSGSPVGTIKLQGSSDPGLDTFGRDVVNWDDITGSDAVVNGAGMGAWNAADTFYKWVRVVYTSTSGSGHMTITANAKGT